MPGGELGQLHLRFPADPNQLSFGSRGDVLKTRRLLPSAFIPIFCQERNQKGFRSHKGRASIVFMSLSFLRSLAAKSLFLKIQRPPRSTRFPYSTLYRSKERKRGSGVIRAALQLFSCL